MPQHPGRDNRTRHGHFSIVLIEVEGLAIFDDPFSNAPSCAPLPLIALNPWKRLERGKTWLHAFTLSLRNRLLQRRLRHAPNIASCYQPEQTARILPHLSRQKEEELVVQI